MKIRNLSKDKLERIREVFSPEVLPATQEYIEGPNGEIVVVLTMTPEHAEEALEHNHSGQRKVNKDKVAELASPVFISGWAFTGDSIKFDENMDLIDGQYRCHTIIETNVEMTTTVIFFAKDEVRRIVDGSSKPRSLTEQARADERDAEHSAAFYQTTLRGLYAIQGYTVKQPRGVRYPTLNYAIEPAFKPALDGLAQLRDAHANKLKAPTWSMFHYMYEINPPVVIDVLHGLLNGGGGYTRGTAPCALYEFFAEYDRLVKAGAAIWGGEAAKTMQHLAVARALRAAIEGHNILAVNGTLQAGECAHEDEAIIWAARELTKAQRLRAQSA